jgi:DNA-binding PadR family transcriptional regulator
VTTSTTLLGLLGIEPAHGYTLKHKYDVWFAQKRPLAFGQVYATLGRFERDGLAEVLDVEAGDGPHRRRYRITSEGVTAVDDWVFGAQDPELFATSTLYARVTVALLSGRPTDQVLAAQREAHLGRMRELQKHRRGATGADLLAVTYELAHLDADLRWIEQSGARLDKIRTQLEGDDRA